MGKRVTKEKEITDIVIEEGHVVAVKTEETPSVELEEIYMPVSKKIFHIDSNINMELFSNLVAFVNEYSGQSIMEIWLSSPGGDCMVTEMIRDLIEEYQMPIVGCYLLGSSAFNLFMTADTYKRLVPGTKGIFHRTYFSDVRMDDTFKPMIDSEFKRFMGESYRTVEETVDKIKLTPSQKRKFKKNEDINFTYAEMVEIIKSLDDERFIFENQEVTE